MHSKLPVSGDFTQVNSPLTNLLLIQPDRAVLDRVRLEAREGWMERPEKSVNGMYAIIRRSVFENEPLRYKGRNER